MKKIHKYPKLKNLLLKWFLKDLFKFHKNFWHDFYSTPCVFCYMPPKYTEVFFERISLRGMPTLNCSPDLETKNLEGLEK